MEGGMMSIFQNPWLLLVSIVGMIVCPLILYFLSLREYHPVFYPEYPEEDFEEELEENLEKG
jgi:Mn2+/Fe2+ NRAMP family transporter|tara:strand:- start:675 stop:860 length:186 start_codon:yes stop_codon:yes gene_type:complete